MSHWLVAAIASTANGFWPCQRRHCPGRRCLWQGCGRSPRCRRQRRGRGPLTWGATLSPRTHSGTPAACTPTEDNGKVFKIKGKIGDGLTYWETARELGAITTITERKWKMFSDRVCNSILWQRRGGGPLTWGATLSACCLHTWGWGKGNVYNWWIKNHKISDVNKLFKALFV